MFKLSSSCNHTSSQVSFITSVVVKDLRLKDKDSSFKDNDKDKDLKIGPREQGLSSRATTLQRNYV